MGSKTRRGRAMGRRFKATPHKKRFATWGFGLGLKPANKILPSHLHGTKNHGCRGKGLWNAGISPYRKDPLAGPVDAQTGGGIEVKSVKSDDSWGKRVMARSTMEARMNPLGKPAIRCSFETPMPIWVKNHAREAVRDLVASAGMRVNQGGLSIRTKSRPAMNSMSMDKGSLAGFLPGWNQSRMMMIRFVAKMGGRTENPVEGIPAGSSGDLALGEALNEALGEATSAMRFCHATQLSRMSQNWRRVSRAKSSLISPISRRQARSRRRSARVARKSQALRNLL